MMKTTPHRMNLIFMRQKDKQRSESPGLCKFRLLSEEDYVIITCTWYSGEGDALVECHQTTSVVYGK